MCRVRKRLQQYKQQLERQTQYKAGLPAPVTSERNRRKMEVEICLY